LLGFLWAVAGISETPGEKMFVMYVDVEISWWQRQLKSTQFFLPTHYFIQNSLSWNPSNYLQTITLSPIPESFSLIKPSKSAVSERYFLSDVDGCTLNEPADALGLECDTVLKRKRDQYRFESKPSKNRKDHETCAM
jgi:hypothetical protein